jgi:hypothetical protein
MMSRLAGRAAARVNAATLIWTLALGALVTGVGVEGAHWERAGASVASGQATLAAGVSSYSPDGAHWE